MLKICLKNPEKFFTFLQQENQQENRNPPSNVSLAPAKECPRPALALAANQGHSNL